MASELQAALDEEYADAWISEQGDQIIGRVDGFGEYDAGYGTYPIVTLTVTGSASEKGGEPIEPGERRAVHCQPFVLRSKLGEHRPALGDGIGVKNLGMRNG